MNHDDTINLNMKNVVYETTNSTLNRESDHNNDSSADLTMQRLQFAENNNAVDNRS